MVYSCTRDPTGEVQFETHIGNSQMYDVVCVYCKSIYTMLFGTQLRLTTKLTYLMTACMYYTPNGGFTAIDALFYKKKVG